MDASKMREHSLSSGILTFKPTPCLPLILFTLWICLANIPWLMSCLWVPLAYVTVGTPALLQDKYQTPGEQRNRTIWLHGDHSFLKETERSSDRDWRGTWSNENTAPVGMGPSCTSKDLSSAVLNATHTWELLWSSNVSGLVSGALQQSC